MPFQNIADVLKLDPADNQTYANATVVAGVSVNRTSDAGSSTALQFSGSFNYEVDSAACLFITASDTILRTVRGLTIRVLDMPEASTWLAPFGNWPSAISVDENTPMGTIVTDDNKIAGLDRLRFTVYDPDNETLYLSMVQKNQGEDQYFSFTTTVLEPLNRTACIQLYETAENIPMPYNEACRMASFAKVVHCGLPAGFQVLTVTVRNVTGDIVNQQDVTIQVQDSTCVVLHSQTASLCTEWPQAAACIHL